MIWGNDRLQEFVAEGGVEFCMEELIGPASIDVRLGGSFIRPVSGKVVRLGGKMKYVPCRMDRGFCTIRPGEFLLATTMERVTLPSDCAAFVQGRSSIGRIGLMVQNAGFVDPGFHGHITLELKNDSGCIIELVPGYPVAQLVFMDAADVTKPYRGKYNGQVDATGSKMYLDGEV